MSESKWCHSLRLDVELSIQCLDTVNWVTGRLFGLQKYLLQQPQRLSPTRLQNYRIYRSDQCLVLMAWAGADLTGGHSCSGRRGRGPWEAGHWRPPGLGGPGRLNYGLQLQSPDCNLNWIYDLLKLETSTTHSVTSFIFRLTLSLNSTCSFEPNFNPARGSGEHCKLPQWGSGQSPA